MNLGALQKLGYGMYIIGSYKGDRLNGQVANTVFQVTSEPPIVAVSINKKNLTHDFIKATRVFSASILHEATPLHLHRPVRLQVGPGLRQAQGRRL